MTRREVKEMANEFIVADVEVSFKAESKKEIAAMKKAVKEALKAVQVEGAKVKTKVY